MRDDCARWHHAAPRPWDEGPGRWVVHRTTSVEGLGDWLSGFLSAFILAAATDRFLFVDAPFDSRLVSFAPYDKFPVMNATTYVTEAPYNLCPKLQVELAQAARADVWVYSGGNRACAHSWAAAIPRVWKGLGLTAQRALFEAHLVYGCPLRYFRPRPAVQSLMAPVVDAKTGLVIAVHARFGDSHFAACADVAEFDTMANQVVDVADLYVASNVTFMIESDDACAQRVIADRVLGAYPSARIAKPFAHASHGVDPAQLATWFALGLADVLIVSTIQHPAKIAALYPDTLGVADHGLVRLSGWSTMAALRSHIDRFHVLCAGLPAQIPDNARPHPYYCRSTLKSNVAAAKLGRGFANVNVQYLPDAKSEPPDGVLWWGMGEFA